MSRPLGLVAGIDHSALMVARAKRRLNGRRGDAALDLRLGEAGDLPFPDERFDAVYAVNSFHLWPDQARALAEAHVSRSAEARRRSAAVDSQLPRGWPFRGRPARKRQETARMATEMLKDLGLQVRQREIDHSPARATQLVRGRKCGRAEA